MNLKVAWLDSTGAYSHIHLTATGADTVCGGHAHHLENRTLVSKAPRRRQGRSNFCKVCFANGGKNLGWFNN